MRLCYHTKEAIMEREHWKQLYDLAQRLGKPLQDRGRYTTAFIVGVFLWAVVHDRPVSWGCRRENWPENLCPRRLPSQSTMSRRLRCASTTELLSAIDAAFQEPPQDQAVEIIDAKPLPVGGYSKDPDVRWGRAAGGSWKGYKFFAVWGRGAVPRAWKIAAMSVSEKRMARELIRQLRGRGRLLGDSQYDVSYLYDLAAKQGYELLAPRERPGTSLGHHYQSPHRVHSIQVMEGPQGKDILQRRNAIERTFGNWTSFGGGLSPLPAWVRRPQRVQLWTHAKLLVNAVRIAKIRARSATAVA
jgi:transposase